MRSRSRKREELEEIMIIGQVLTLILQVFPSFSSTLCEFQHLRADERRINMRMKKRMADYNGQSQFGHANDQIALQPSRNDNRAIS